MKKKLLAVGIAAALISGAASAATVNANGVGHINILPYYSVQEGNATLISITNTDAVNGKVVKVRFRGAKTSDDVFDFQVFLSPGDVWTGAVTQGEDGIAKMSTSDNSCTLPANVNQSFVTARLQDAEKATGTREGYVEVINMGDIAPTNALFTAVKHVNGVAPCTSSVLVGSDPLVPADLTSLMSVPTGTLTSYAVVIDVDSSKAFTVPATAVSPAAAPGVKYWRQANIPVAYSTTLTADRVFDPAGGNVKMYEYDLPDLSTPYGDGVDAFAQRDAVTAALAKGSVITEFVTDESVNATTDVVLSQPTRRYYYTWLDVPSASTDPLLTLATVNGADGVYASLNAANNTVAVGAPSFTDREEGVIANPTSIVISPNPQPQAAIWTIQGEVAVIAINNGATPTGSLGASLTAQDYSTAFTDGWVRLSTTTATGAQQLPVIGFSAINVFNNGVGAAGTNYGLTLPLRW